MPPTNMVWMDSNYGVDGVFINHLFDALIIRGINMRSLAEEFISREYKRQRDEEEVRAEENDDREYINELNNTNDLRS